MGIDTYVYLRDSMGNLLDQDDDIMFPANACSLMDGIGGTHPGASNLAAGTYYIEVHHYDDMEEIPEYYLDITVQ
jgi:hypothetical protein